jgi:ABC-type transport system substrate-binding protein
VVLGASLVATACSSDKASTSTAGTTATTAASASSAGSTASTGGPGSTAAGATTGSSTGAAATAPSADGEAATMAPVADHPHGGTLRYASISEPTTFDPHKGASGGDHVSLYPIFDRLLNADPKTLAPQPFLAKGWKFTDPKTLVLELQQGVMFTDGTPFDAAAVVANIERGKTMPDSSIKTDLASVDSVEATGQFEATLHLNAPDSSLLGVLADRAGMMVSPTAAAKPDFDSHPIGTGPYPLKNWTPGDNWTYGRNDTYWHKGLPYLDGLEIHLVSDANTRINGLRSGQFDFIDGIPPASLQDVQGADGITVDNSPTILEYMIWLNTARGPLADVRVRQAINMAIDRDALWKGTMYGTGEPAWIPVPSQHWAFDKALAPSFKYDPAAAKQLLVDAGYGDGFTLNITSTAQDDYTQRAEVVQADLAKIGIKLVVTPQQTTDSVQSYFKDKTVDGYNSAMTARADPSITYQTVFSAASFYNAAATSPAGFEDLLKAAREAQTTADRQAAFAALDKAVVDNALWVPLVFPASISAYSSSFKGFVPSLIAKPDFSTMYKDG